MTAQAAVPSAVLLGTFTPGSPEWEEARGGLCITATEIAAVLNLNPSTWANRYELWHKKAGLPVASFEPNPFTKWGVRLEDDVAEEYAERHPEHPLLSTGTWRHVERSWQRATPDRLHSHRIVEIKTSPFDDGEWGPDGSDQVPLHYRCQIIWQQDTLGLHERAHVAVLISGWDYRELYVDYDEADALLMRDAAQTFLHDVRHGVRPDIDDSDRTYNTLRRQPDRYDREDVEIPGPIADQYEKAGAHYRAADTAYTQAKSHVLAALGTGRNAVHLGRRIAYRVANDDGTTRSLHPAR
ncbi:YqaJ viral recombinase family protein [Streptomyces sp. Ac-502]|uniref:YqaJ viral recombinase family nuclease n=1 Tax=Streptomyces sp. Ac-502 TaxID=3342801 RepID=UPI0038626CBD